MIEAIKELGDRLARLPGVAVEVTSFPSGAVWLDVWRNKRLFVLKYSTDWGGFGVDEVEDDDGLTNYYRYTFRDLKAAAEQLTKLVESAIIELPRSISTPPLLDLPSVHTPLDSTPDRS